MNLITISKYLQFENLPSPLENIAQVELAISTATSIIEREIEQTFGILVSPAPSPIEITEILNGLGERRLYVHQRPVQSVSKLEYWDGMSWVEYDSVSMPYTFKIDSNIVYFTGGHRFYKGWQNIRITYTYGYDIEAPDDLQYACYLLTKYILDEIDRQGIRQQSDGEQSFTYEHDLPKAVVKILERYKAR